jgi:two-component system, chemotaxis family, protein-glutamate methylesterase/glutaminase
MQPMVALTAEQIIARRPALVVVGGSAGAVEVLQRLTSKLTTSFGPAMAVVLHMPSGSRGVLHELLAAPSRPPMKVAEDKEPITPGSIYFATPGYHLLVESDGSFALSLDELVHYSRPSIDVLFETAAEAYKDRALGIILSGANSDGAEGLRLIEDAGGAAIVQQPDSAEVPAMPQAAMNACRDAYVADVATIAQLLASL